MKILSIAVVRSDGPGARILAIETDLSSVNFFQRGTMQEFCAFLSKTIAERTDRGVRLSVEENENVAHSFCTPVGLAGVIIADKEYPQRVAFALLARVLDDFSQTYPRDVWLTCKDRLSWPKLRETLVKYQNPHEADPIMRVQRELDETKIVLHRTINSLLERGDQLEDLVARSDELGSQSKMFFKTAKKQNSCCLVQ